MARTSASEVAVGGLWALAIILAILKMTGAVDWWWWWILLPIYGPTAILAIIGIIYLVSRAVTAAGIRKKYRKS